MSKEEKINILTNHFIMHIKEDTRISEWNFPKVPFICDIYLEDNVAFTTKQILNLNKVNGQINLYSQNHTKILMQFGIKFTNQNNLEITNHILGNQNKTQIKLRVLQEDDCETNLKTVGSIKSNTKENEFLEEIKVLNIQENKITCYPDLIVESNDAIANHNVTMKSFDQEELFYLETKGLSETKAKQCIMEGFIQSMQNE